MTADVDADTDRGDTPTATGLKVLPDNISSQLDLFAVCLCSVFVSVSVSVPVEVDVEAEVSMFFSVERFSRLFLLTSGFSGIDVWVSR